MECTADGDQRRGPRWAPLGIPGYLRTPDPWISGGVPGNGWSGGISIIPLFIIIILLCTCTHIAPDRRTGAGRGVNTDDTPGDHLKGYIHGTC